MKKIYMQGSNIKGAFIILLTVILSGCNRDRNNPGWDYFPDMFYSIAYETFSKNPNFENGMTMRMPVPGTVPRGYVPFNYTIDADSRIKAGNELVNPFSPDNELILKGKESIIHFASAVMVSGVREMVICIPVDYIRLSLVLCCQRQHINCVTGRFFILLHWDLALWVHMVPRFYRMTGGNWYYI
jgi:hypothetical protein